jgi:hypothetical protein
MLEADLFQVVDNKVNTSPFFHFSNYNMAFCMDRQKHNISNLDNDLDQSEPLHLPLSCGQHPMGMLPHKQG